MNGSGDADDADHENAALDEMEMDEMDETMEDEDEEEERMVEGDIEMARQVFQRGYKDLKDRSLKEEVCYFSITPKL